MTNPFQYPLVDPAVLQMWQQSVTSDWIPYPPQHPKDLLQEGTNITKKKFNQNLKEWDEWLEARWKEKA